MESIREIFVPENNKIVLTIPDNYIGQKNEVFAYMEEKKKLINCKRKRLLTPLN